LRPRLPQTSCSCHLSLSQITTRHCHWLQRQHFHQGSHPAASALGVVHIPVLGLCTLHNVWYGTVGGAGMSRSAAQACASFLRKRWVLHGSCNGLNNMCLECQEHLLHECGVCCMCCSVGPFGKVLGLAAWCTLCCLYGRPDRPCTLTRTGLLMRYLSSSSSGPGGAVLTCLPSMAMRPCSGRCNC
jgi:hypothetical protein